MSTYEISQIMKRLGEMDEHHRTIHGNLTESIEEIKAQLEPVAKLYRDFEGMSRGIKWVFGILVALGGAYLLFKNIFNKPIV